MAKTRKCRWPIMNHKDFTILDNDFVDISVTWHSFLLISILFSIWSKSFGRAGGRSMPTSMPLGCPVRFDTSVQIYASYFIFLIRCVGIRNVSPCFPYLCYKYDNLFVKQCYGKNIQLRITFLIFYFYYILKKTKSIQYFFSVTQGALIPHSLLFL